MNQCPPSPSQTALERHWSDINDQAMVHEIYHDDVMLEFPQGGERPIGLANARAMREAYPTSPTMRTERIRGSGELWVAENVITDDGKPMHTVNILEFRDGKVTHETIYFGDPWEPPPGARSGSRWSSRHPPRSAKRLLTHPREATGSDNAPACTEDRGRRRVYVAPTG